MLTGIIQRDAFNNFKGTSRIVRFSVRGEKIRTKKKKKTGSPQYQHAYAHNRVRLECADGSHVDELLQVEYGRQGTCCRRGEKNDKN